MTYFKFPFCHTFAGSSNTVAGNALIFVYIAIGTAFTGFIIAGVTGILGIIPNKPYTVYKNFDLIYTTNSITDTTTTTTANNNYT